MIENRCLAPCESPLEWSVYTDGADVLADERVTVALERAKADPEGPADAKQLTTASDGSSRSGTGS